MHDYLFSAEIVRFAFVLGIAVSMLMYERFHLTTGSIVVPGYIAIFIVYPLVVAVTFLNALASYALVNHVLRRRFLLYGRTKFTVMALLSITIQAAALKLSPQGAWLWEAEIPLFVGAGYVVPALIAHDMGRQGVKRTASAVLLAGLVVAAPIGLALLADLPGVNDLAPLAGFGEMSVVTRWVPLAVLLSAAASWAVTTNFGLKAGGFIGAAYIGMFMGDPYQVAVAFIVAFVSYIIVRGVLMPRLILFGRHKFAAMLLTSSMISWSLLWTGTELFSARFTDHMDLASLALTPLFVPGLLANDMDRTSPPKVVLGVAMAASFVVPTTWWVQSAVEGTPMHPGWKLTAAAMLLVIFGPQLAVAARWAGARTVGRLVRPLAQRVYPTPADSGPALQPAVDPIHAAIERAHQDALDLITWSRAGLAHWLATNPELLSEARTWLDEQLGAADAHPHTALAAGD